ncbi:MAG: hypothetical protein ACLR3C_18285 [Eggerthella lenta]
MQPYLVGSVSAPAATQLLGLSDETVQAVSKTAAGRARRAAGRRAGTAPPRPPSSIDVAGDRRGEENGNGNWFVGVAGRGSTRRGGHRHRGRRRGSGNR